MLDAGTTTTAGAPRRRPASSTPSSTIPGLSPPFGVAGYAKDGSGVIVEHRYDLWLLPYDGSAPRNLTDGVGSKQEIKSAAGPHWRRSIRSLPRAERDGTRDSTSAKPLTLSAYGE